MISATDYQSTFDTKLPHNRCNDFCQCRIIDTDYHTLCSGWVCQRTKDIEYGTDSHLASRLSHKPHGFVKGLCKHKSNADFIHACFYFFRFHHDIYTKLLQYITGTALAGNGTIAMFCHRNTGCCRHNGRCRRNIERIRAIPSGSNQINIMIGMRMNMLCFICQHRGQTSDFINRLSFHPQSGQKSSDLSLCSCTGQKKFHDFSCFFPCQILSVCYSLNCLFHIHNTNYSFFTTNCS